MANTSSNVLITSSWNNLPNDVINNIFEYWSPKLEQRKQDLEKNKILNHITDYMYNYKRPIWEQIIDYKYDEIISNILKYCNMFNRLNDGIYYENVVVNDKSVIIYHGIGGNRLQTKLYYNNDPKKLTEYTKKRIVKTFIHIHETLIHELRYKLIEIKEKLRLRL